MLLLCNSLGEDVGKLVSSGHVVESNVAAFNFVPKEPVTDFDVFGTIVELWVVSNRDSGLVIDVESDGEGNWPL